RPRSLQGLVLPMPRFGLRYLGAHPPGSGAAQPRRAALRIHLRHRDQDRLGSTMAAAPSSSASGRNYGRLIRWVDYRLPFVASLEYHYTDYPTPVNLNYWWNFGSLAGITLVIMIVSGVVLAVHYTPHADLAFESVERIMRDVNYGWLLRYIHMNGASMFFLIVYIHLFRGLYYGSYKYPRELLWILGVVILILMIATAFMG